MMPLVPLTSTPAMLPPEPSIVIDLVMVTAPKPPGSSTLISPLGAVLEIAPANVLHGAVRLHGLASSPTPETQVRVACAPTGADPLISNSMTEATTMAGRVQDRQLDLNTAVPRSSACPCAPCPSCHSSHVDATQISHTLRRRAIKRLSPPDQGPNPERWHDS